MFFALSEVGCNQDESFRFQVITKEREKVRQTMLHQP